MGIHEDILVALTKFETALASALENEGADAVKTKMQEVLDRDVYSFPASDFFLSTRRMDNGGLRDRENMMSKVEDGDTLLVENVAESQSLWGGPNEPRDLTEIVEYGYPDYNPPAGAHDFHGTTEKEVITSGEFHKALINGLRRQGFLIE